MRKRAAGSSSSNGPLTKKICRQNDVDKIMDTMENNLKTYVKRATTSVKDAIGRHFKNDLNKTNSEKNTMQQTIDILNVEKRNLEQKNVALRELQHIQKIKSDVFEEKIAVLEQQIRFEREIFDGEKKVFEERIAALELKKPKIACAHCQTALQPVVFCNSECGK